MILINSQFLVKKSSASTFSFRKSNALLYHCMHSLVSKHILHTVLHKCAHLSVFVFFSLQKPVGYRIPTEPLSNYDNFITFLFLRFIIYGIYAIISFNSTIIICVNPS